MLNRVLMAVFVIVATLIVSLGVSSASAGVRVSVDLSKQRMYVYVDKQLKYTWKVSTARKGYRTPTGKYRPTRMHKRYFSKKYYNSPMPYSIFYRGGYAIHGTTAVKRLGRTASHGCTRLLTANARKLYLLVKQHGANNTIIRHY